MKSVLSPYVVTTMILRQKTVNTCQARLIKSPLHISGAAHKLRISLKSSKRPRQSLKKLHLLSASAAVALSCMIVSGVSPAFHADAAELDSYQLTVPQTLALYGDSLQAVYYNGAATEPVTFDYIGSTADLSALNGYPSGYGTTYCSGWYVAGNNVLTQAQFSAYTYLIYKWDVTTIADATGTSFSLKLEQSIDITAYGYKTSLLFSTGSASMFAAYRYGEYNLYGADTETLLGTATLLSRPSVSGYWGIVRTIPRPVLFVDGQSQGLYYFSDDVATTFTGAAILVGSTEDGGDPVTVGGSYFATKDEHPAVCMQEYHYVYPQNNVYYDSAVYLLLQCPILYGDYILPEPETPGGVDLTQIEEYLQQQGVDIANISEESTVQTRQLIAILAKLEQIRTQMPESFNPTLNPQAAQTLPRLDWTAQQSAIASGTLSAQDVENMTPAADMLTDGLGDILGASGLTLFAVGLVSICAAGWFLTRGRG